MEKKRHYLVYQITNLINQKIYIGIHSTENIDDGYFGSGTHLNSAIKKHGIENFQKEILFDFNNPDEMIEKERELVDRQFIARKDVYNIKLGGEGWLTFDSVAVKDSEGNCFRVHKTDERWLSGELKSIASGFITVKDDNENYFKVLKTDSRYVNKEVFPPMKGKILVKDLNENVFLISNVDPRYINGELKSINSNMLCAKDINNNYYWINNKDLRLQSGELVGHWKDRKHTEETKKIMSEKAKIHQKGERNSQFGSCWIHNESENKKIKKEELDSFLLEGWIKGRKMKF